MRKTTQEFDRTNLIAEQERMKNAGCDKANYESAPPGWEKTVKKIKKNKDIDNPFALAYWMKSQGYSPKTKKEK